MYTSRFTVLISFFMKRI